MRVLRRVVSLLALAIVFAPIGHERTDMSRPGSASTRQRDRQWPRRRLGVTSGYMGAGVFGFEADFGYSPDFFGSRRESARTTPSP
jgi:hypothetical protein